MSFFKVKLLYPDAKIPTKAHAQDSGWDVYAHSFKEVWAGNAMETCNTPDPDTGMIPGFQDKPSTLTLNPMERAVIGTGFAGYADTYGAPISIQGTDLIIDFKMVPRSGNRRKEGLEVHFGTVDFPYRGEFCAIVTNLGNQARTIRLGDRIAQVTPSLVPMLDLKLVEELDDTDRGASGFGDSGKR